MWKMKNRYCITVIITLPTPFPPVRKNKLGFLKNHCPVGGIVNLNSKDLGLGCFVAKSCQTLLWPHGLQSARLLCPWNFPGKNTGVGFHFLLQGSEQPRDWTLVSCIGRWILYHWTPWGAWGSEIRVYNILSCGWGPQVKHWLLIRETQMMRYLPFHS